MDPSKHFTELIVWQKAHRFVLNVYLVTKCFPREETYGLVSQFRRASISLAANIAEGYAKKGLKDKMRFLNIAHGSLTECEYYIRLTHDLQYADVTQLGRDLQEVSRLLNAYARGIKKSLQPST